MPFSPAARPVAGPKGSVPPRDRGEGHFEVGLRPVPDHGGFRVKHDDELLVAGRDRADLKGMG
jgi:hypothetical protein